MTVLKMGFFKSKAEKELEAAVNTMREGGKLKPVILTKYENILAEYKSKMKGYSHKDQKPYWT